MMEKVEAGLVMGDYGGSVLNFLAGKSDQLLIE